MNIGADAGMPSRRSWNTCPSSCTSSSNTNPIANFQPQISEYAATETSAEADVVNSFSLGSRSSRPLPLAANFARSRPSAASPPRARRQAGRSSSRGGGPGRG